MAMFCERHTAQIFDRGGQRYIGSLGNLSRVRWERLRDDISQASVLIEARDVDCDTTLGLTSAGRHELVIFRGNDRVWEGPITHIAHTGNSTEISARDVGHYIYRTIMRSEYNSSFPNIESVLSRMQRILNTEMQRMEALDPPVNVLPYVSLHHRASGDAETSSHTLPWQMTVYEHMDALAARGGLDYTVVGRALHLWDTHTAIGQTASVTQDDFLGPVVITEYGMELATLSAITDGKGRAGYTGGIDPYYGLVEILDTAYDEETGTDWNDPDQPSAPEPPSIADMQSQAQRVMAGRNPTPIVVRVPDNSSLNPNGVLAVADLVPGVFIPLRADLPGRSLSQMQKLDKVTFEETAAGETIQVVLSPAPVEGSNQEDA